MCPKIPATCFTSPFNNPWDCEYNNPKIRLFVTGTLPLRNGDDLNDLGGPDLPMPFKSGSGGQKWRSEDHPLLERTRWQGMWTACRRGSNARK